MHPSHFETFISAFAALDERSRLLAGDWVLCPPRDDYGYQSTPKNSITFASMGCDGVHYSILKRDGLLREDSPVVQVNPMDSNDVIVIAQSFLHFLADGCAVSTDEMEAVFQDVITGKILLVDFLSKHFDCLRLLDEERTANLGATFGHLIERKVSL